MSAARYTAQSSNRLAGVSAMELAGLEPATSWVRLPQAQVDCMFYRIFERDQGTFVRLRSLVLVARVVACSSSPWVRLVRERQGSGRRQVRLHVLIGVVAERFIQPDLPDIGLGSSANSTRRKRTQVTTPDLRARLTLRQEKVEEVGAWPTSSAERYFCAK
jgi:hypothetical protein